MSQADIERMADEDDGPLADGWENTVILGLPPGKDAVKLLSTGTCRNGSAGAGKATRRA